MFPEKKYDNLKRNLPSFFQNLIIIISAFIIIIVINHIFHLGFFNNFIKIESSYLYSLLALYVSSVFLIYPFGGTKKYYKGFYFLIDILLFFLTLSIGLLFSFKGLDIYNQGWMMGSPMPYTLFGFIFWFLIMEATRRTQGTLLTLIILYFSFYPLFANKMPGFLNGIGFNIIQTMNYHVFSIESLIGLPMKVTGDLVIGFMIFGVVLVISGGGSFFMNLAFSLLGSSRGGVAKVSIFSSALFGSMSGSAISNVITTGSITIPAMVKTNFPPHIAAAIEACASTGGVLMPPVMGATAFLISQFLNIPYLNVAISAAIPSILYYLGLFIQVDAYAARNNIFGLSKKDIPSLKETIKNGWFYIGALLILVIFLFLRVESQAPFYASIFLIICANFRKETRINLCKIRKLLLDHIQTINGLITVISAIGLIIGSLSITGVAHSFAREITYFSKEIPLLMVLLSALASFILGMGITITACYVLLAITIAPSLIQSGFDPLAVHLFLMYWGMISYITPPVATAVYAAAAISRSSIFDTGLAAMRLGIVTYIIPFYFIYNPALILKGSFSSILYHISLAICGVFLIASSLGKYIIGVGVLTSGFNKYLENFIIIPLLFLSGVLLAAPEFYSDLFGIILAISILFIVKVLKRKFLSKLVDRKYG